MLGHGNHIPQKNSVSCIYDVHITAFRPRTLCKKGFLIALSLSIYIHWNIGTATARRSVFAHESSWDKVC